MLSFAVTQITLQEYVRLLSQERWRGIDHSVIKEHVPYLDFNFDDLMVAVERNKNNTPVHLYIRREFFCYGVTVVDIDTRLPSLMCSYLAYCSSAGACVPLPQRQPSPMQHDLESAIKEF